MLIPSWSTTAAQDKVVQREVDKQNAAVAVENASRTAQNIEIAARTPPGTPLAMLPTFTIPTFLLNRVLAPWFLQVQAQQVQDDLSTPAIKDRWDRSSDAQRTAAVAALAP